MDVPVFTWIWKDRPPKGVDSPEGAKLYLAHRYRMQPVKCIVKRYVTEIRLYGNV